MAIQCNKDRIVGMVVFLAIGVIFLPSVFHQDQPVMVDSNTLIPNISLVEPIVINVAIKPPHIRPAPLPDDAFQAVTIAGLATGPVNNTTETVIKPSLNNKGLPNAWVIQVGSFSSQVQANQLKNKLLKNNNKVYTRSVKTTKGEFFRVFVGPYIDKSRVIAAHKSIDTAQYFESRILRFVPE